MRRHSSAYYSDRDFYSRLMEIALETFSSASFDNSRNQNDILNKLINENKVLRKILNLFLDSPHETVLVTDPEGNVIYINRFYAAYLGYSVEELIGKRASDVIENSRMSFVAQTNLAEIGTVQKIRGKDIIVNRLPLCDENKVIAVIGKGTIFEAIERNLITNTNRPAQLSKCSFKTKYSIDGIISQSPKMAEMKRTIYKLAQYDTNVLIMGETGVGKEMVAQSIHQLSPRKNQPFIAINCSAIPENLLESELFGYSEGAFTGATKRGAPGKFELAGEGTVFLDEIGEMSLNLQAKLLRVLQEKEVVRIGGRDCISVPVRVISATNQPLEKLINGEKIRQDLFYRLRGSIIEIPPLRERREDVIPLWRHFVAIHALQYKMPEKEISKSACEYLQSYSWPGNVREIESTAAYVMQFVESPILEVKHLRNIIPLNEHSFFFGKGSQITNQTVFGSLQASKNNRSKAAQLMGISRSSFYRLLRKFQIENKYSKHCHRDNLGSTSW